MLSCDCLALEIPVMWSSALGTLTKYWILRISLLENPHIGFSEDFDHISNMKTVQKKRMEHFDYTNLINKILFIYAVPVEWLPGKHKSNILVATANSCFTNYLQELDERLQSMVETIFMIRQESWEHPYICKGCDNGHRHHETVYYIFLHYFILIINSCNY